MIDYSPHLLRASKLLHKIYEDCESSRYMDAMSDCLEAITEIKMAYNAIHHNVDQKNPGHIQGVWNFKGDEWKKYQNDQA